MKSFRVAIPAFIVILSLFSFRPADESDAVVGTWLNGTKKGHVEIYKKGGTYFGKLVWLKEPNDPTTGKPKTDIKNADAAKRNRPIMNLNIMYNFKYDGNNVWSDGKIYNPEDGKEYNCKMTLTSPNTLDVRGYMGISLIGKTQTWTRVK
ncbi:DUF2147 domain-containing protein [Fibrisoma montanum]|uniref:DUF2147 domain-containing protein n=1 Tax=Fibrisoma montanum TaxID=2305895 RepID=A0A418ME75_9BACT|nr:DUF2147 domain-containing protein [Fibrisoma montanum]RIV25065.1 DUF2147 domain-containing protein [Fibrisoma montanum]